MSTTHLPHHHDPTLFHDAISQGRHHNHHDHNHRHRPVHPKATSQTPSSSPTTPLGNKSRNTITNLLSRPLFTPKRKSLLCTLLVALVHSLVTAPLITTSLFLVFHQPIVVAGKSVTTSTKSSSCTYTVVINEFDSDKCSSMNPYVQADGTGMESERTHGMMKDGGKMGRIVSGRSGYSKQASAASSNVESKLESVENALLEEMVRCRELNSTLNRHSSMLASAQRTLESYKANFTHVFRAMVNMERRLHHQRRINRSLNKKLSNVILDVVEVNNVLTRKIPKGSAKKTPNKSFQVESVGKVRSCVGVSNAEKVYQDCADVYDSGHHRSDVYYIKPLYSACPIPVWCDMDSPKAGWLVIQRRQDGSVDFNRQWADYRDGFGDVIGEHWLGNDNIFLLTNQARYTLRIDLWDFSGNRVHALYSNFKIEGERDRYRLHVSGFSGSAKDSLMRHNNKQFSTGDRDHDSRRDASCATEWEAGWWFDKCWYALLNGPYQNQSDVKYKGIAWKSWKFEQLRGAEMKIRPTHNSRR